MKTRNSRIRDTQIIKKVKDKLKPKGKKNHKNKKIVGEKNRK